MHQEQLRAELANLGIVISHGHIPHFSAENPVQLHSLEAIGPCSIGAFTYGSNLFLHYASVGRYCSIGQDVCIGLGNHRTDLFSTHPLAVKGGSQFAWHDHFQAMRGAIAQAATPGPGLPNTSVGNDVWIGRGVLVNDNVTIGDGAIIGAGAVVTSDIPSYAIAVGVPAKVKRYRFGADIIDRFLRLRWWDFDLSALDNIPPDPVAFLDAMEEARDAGALQTLPTIAVNIGPDSDE